MKKENSSDGKEVGAAAALRRLEQSELDAWEAKERCEKELEDAKKTKGKDAASKVRIAELSLTEAVKRHDVVAKQLLSYERSVSETKREGVKIPQGDFERFAETLVRSLRLANEQHITNICQDLLRCKTPNDVYKLAADSMRGCFVSSIKAATENAMLPDWAAKAVERGL